MLDGGLTCLGILGAFLLSMVVASLCERRRLARAERAFLAGREVLGDDEFLRRAGAEPGEEEFFLAARRTMANWCGLVPFSVG